MRLFVVVSGPPGSGKTTLSAPLADQLGLPLIAKDAIKEALMDVLPPTTVDESRRIGTAAVAVLYRLAREARTGAVIENAWHAELARSELAALPGPLVEVFCRCDPELAQARYQLRAASGDRHPGHLDRQREWPTLYGPEQCVPVAGGWPVIEVDTNAEADVAAVVTAVRAVIRTP